MNFWHEDYIDDSDVFDLLRVERSSPMKDEEAASIEALCMEATPGPLIIDDQAEGDGSLVVTLPDDRHIISLTMDIPAEDVRTCEANAQLFCRARHLILRLLRDRERWHSERAELLEKIETLEAALVDRSVGDILPNRARDVSLRPR